jgi:hypothetical protein
MIRDSSYSLIERGAAGPRPQPSVPSVVRPFNGQVFCVKNVVTLSSRRNLFITCGGSPCTETNPLRRGIGSSGYRPAGVIDVGVIT